MKKLITTLALAGLACTTAFHAQAADPKTEMAEKVVQLQQGPELDQLVFQIAASTTRELIANWSPKLQANVPKAKQQKASEALEAELKKYVDDASKLIGKQVSKVNNDVLVPAYAERFTQEELQQIATFFESPTFKKLQAASPELRNMFVQKLFDAARPDVVARAKQFNDAALKIVGEPKASQPARK